MMVYYRRPGLMWLEEKKKTIAFGPCAGCTAAIQWAHVSRETKKKKEGKQKSSNH